MRAFTIGSSGFVIPLASVESVKWFGLLCMIQEHVFRYVFAVYPYTVYLLGRMAFPLFAIAICRAVPSDRESTMHVCGRLLTWGVIAELCRWAVLPVGGPVSVLFTFMIGLFASSLMSFGAVGYVGIAACLALSGFVEYGFFGVLFVILLRVHFQTLRWWPLCLAVGAVCAANASWVPAVAFALAPFAARFSIERVPGFFYWSYAGQWPVLWGLRYVL